MNLFSQKGLASNLAIVPAPAKKVVALLATLLLLATAGAYLASGVIDVTPEANGAVGSCSAAQVGGTVFNDTNSNGSQQPNEPGVSGVTVTVTPTSGAPTTATTDAQGNWTAGASGAVRIEYSLPAGYFDGTHGTSSGTSVQFSNAGDCANDLGVLTSTQYCQSNPDLVTPCYVFGDYNGEFGNVKGAAEIAWNSSGVATVGSVATHSQIGSTWGVAYDRLRNDLFLGTFIKRHTSIGPSGTGAIYKVDRDTGGTVSTFVNLNTVFGAGYSGVDTRTNGGTYDYFHDPDAFNLVGHIGLGDIELTNDFSTLFAVNLASGDLVKIPVTNPTSATKIAIPSPAGCSGPVPYALGMLSDTELLVGGTCTTASPPTAYIYKYNIANGTFGASPVFTFSFNYPHNDPGPWGPWSNQWDPIFKPQPWLTDIQLEDGDLVLGIRDRFGDLSGYKTGSPDPNDSGLYSSISQGDLLRACTNGSTWTLENNGTCGGVTATAPATVGSGDGPGGGEFYDDESPRPGGQNARGHKGSGAGGLATAPSLGLLASTALDPLAFRSGGVIWYDQTDGSAPRAAQIYQTPENTQSPPANAFGKANGLGDLEVLCSLAPIEIGNRVWNDLNANGIQDPDEAGVAGITVTLRLNGATVATTTTDASGEYYFNSSNVQGGIKPNTAYVIEFASIPADRVISAANQGSNDQIDSDATLVAGTPTISVTTGAPGSTDHSLDVGLSPNKATLGDFVWNDLNGNGQQDSGEPGVQGVTVELLQGTTVIATQVTGADGHYLFTNLDPGTYTVHFILPSGLDADFTTQNSGADATDSDADPTTGKTGTYTLVLGQNELTVDAGVILPVDLIIDKQQSGTFTTGTQVTYTLDTSNAGPGIEPGPITVVDTLPTGVSFVDAAGTGWTCSHAAGVVTCTHAGPLGVGASLPQIVMHVTVTATPGEVILNKADVSGIARDINLSNNHDEVSNQTPKATLGDFVWNDLDRDGQQDPGEPGVAGVTVHLLDTQGNQVASTVTDSTGHYLFTNLVPGDYVVHFVLPAGYEISPKDVGDDNTDSDADPITGSSAVVTLAAGADNRTVDAGISLPVDLVIDKELSAGSVFNHGNAVTYTLDVSNAGPGIEPGPITVVDHLPSTLTFVSATGSGWTCSQAAGVVTCTRPGSLGVGESAPTINMVVTVQATAGDSVLNPADVSGVARDINLSNNHDEVVVSVGVASLGDFVWEDTNLDGIQDPGEPGVAGVIVKLLDSTGTVISTTTTDSSGHYLFNGLNPGSYQVEFSLPNGYQFTVANAGADTQDSDADVTTGKTATVTLSNGENNHTVDAGLTRAVDLTIDKAQSGTFITGTTATYTLDVKNLGPATEPGPIVVVDHLPAGVSFASASGVGWSCTNAGQDVTCHASGPLGKDASLPTLTLTVNVTAQPNTSLTNTATVSGQARDINLANNTDSVVQIVPKASIGDRVWEDINRNGTQEPGEPGIPGITVHLLDDAGNVVATTTTDATGLYLFDNLVPGTYSVKVDVPAGWNATTPNVGSDDSLDSDIDVGGATGQYDLSPGEKDVTADAGLTRPVDLQIVKTLKSGQTLVTNGPIVYELLISNNGPGYETGPVTVIDQIPAGLSNATATGTGWTCSTANSVITCLTQAPIVAGGQLPLITVNATITAGPATAITNTAEVRSTNVETTLVNNKDDVTVAIAKAAIGDFIWNDLDGDGLQDPDELGIGGVSVTLYGPNGPKTLVTDATGHFLFDNLIPGTYTLCVDVPKDWTATLVGAGNDKTKDSNIDPTKLKDGKICSEPITVAAGEVNLDVDGGLRGPVDLVIDKKFVSGEGRKGKQVTYSLEVFNIGPGWEKGPLTVVDHLPAEMAFVSYSGAGWSCSASGYTVTCTNQSGLKSGEHASLINITTSVVLEPSTQKLLNKADVKGANPIETELRQDNNFDEVEIPAYHTPVITGLSTTLVPWGIALTAIGLLAWAIGISSRRRDLESVIH